MFQRSLALRRRVLTGALAALLLTTVMEAAARPRVCLVLSGGGARGAAHVGVVKALEELRVPIDCIAGTSMGSLVGGAYASGMTVAEMEDLLRTISTRQLFVERPPRQDQAIRRKLDDRSILFGLELGLRDGELLFPKGAVSGVQLETVLRQVSRIQGFRKFDALPIPFRAVATDLVTGKAVVFSEGELANVMRASMSVPGVIAPAEFEGKILVDGGLMNNLPVDVARAMGADVVIAVNLGTPLMKREALGSVLGVIGQMINVLTEQNVQASLASLKETDILIEPGLGDFSAGNFDELSKAVPIGYAAVRAAAPRLAALSVPPSEYAELQLRRIAALPADVRPVDEIRFEPMARVNPEMMKGQLETQPGLPLDQAKLDRDMRQLYGTGDFEHLNYRILEEAGGRVLIVDAVEKAWGPDYLRFGLGLGSDFKGDAFFNLAASYRRTWINELGGEWRTDLQFGRTSLLATEFHQPLQTRRFLFVAPRAQAERRTVDLYDGSDRIARYDLRSLQAGLDFGADLHRYGELRAGVMTGTLKANLDTGPASLAPPEGTVRLGALRARAIIDQLDSANFPRFGYAGSANLFVSRTALGADDDYTKWDADFAGAYSVGSHTLSLGLKAGGPSSNGTLPRYDQFLWGGFLQQSGYPYGALIGQRLTFGRVVYAYRLREQTFFEGIYLGASLEAGRMDQPLVPGSNTGLLKSAAVFVALDTLLGPFYLAYGRAADGSQSAYLYLGRP